MGHTDSELKGAERHSEKFHHDLDLVWPPSKRLVPSWLSKAGQGWNWRADSPPPGCGSPLQLMILLLMILLWYYSRTWLTSTITLAMRTYSWSYWSLKVVSQLMIRSYPWSLITHGERKNHESSIIGLPALFVQLAGHTEFNLVIMIMMIIIMTIIIIMMISMTVFVRNVFFCQNVSINAKKCQDVPRCWLFIVLLFLIGLHDFW